MNINWINKFSLIDFPDKVSCIVFTSGCNFRCSYCHNSEFVIPEQNSENIVTWVIPEKWFFKFLEKRKGLLDGVSICWWEPTIQKGLVEFCEKVKNMWFLVKLDTNWTNPKVIKELLDKNFLDYIAMDVKHSLSKIKDVTEVNFDVKRIEESMKLILNSWINYEFRTTIVKWMHTSEDIKDISKSIIGAKNYYLQNYKSWNTLVRDFKWRSFTWSELKEFREVSSGYVENVGIRN